MFLQSCNSQTKPAVSEAAVLLVSLPSSFSTPVFLWKDFIIPAPANQLAEISDVKSLNNSSRDRDNPTTLLIP